MEIPDLVRQELGDEAADSAVNLGDEDLVCFTPTRTLLYRSEGLISDESIDVFEHDVERLSVNDGRRKSTFQLEYVDRTESFSVSRDRTEPVLERLLGGVLRVAGVLDPEEDVAGVFRFSELTLIITEGQVVKTVGSYVWDQDYEEFPYSKVTGLEFEEGSVATQVIIEVDGRPRRVKAPNDQAPLVKQTLTKALFEFYEVESVSELNEVLQPADSEDGDGASGTSDTERLTLDENISPLVGGSEGEEGDNPLDEPLLEADDDADESPDKTATEATQSSTAATQEQASESTETLETEPSGDGIDPEEFRALQERVGTLTEAVKRQNELLKDQHETIRRLIEELQQRD